MMEQKSNDNNHRIKRLQDFLENSPNDCFLLHALALENLKIDQLEEAINIFEKVLTIDSKYIGSYYHLGKSYEKAANTEKAIMTYEKGITIAQQIRDFHSLSELRGALELLLDGDD